VTVEADPESFVIARERFELSARNVFKARLEGIRPLTSGRVVLLARWGGLAVRAALTPGSVQRLKLTRGQSAFFYLKAVAVRKV
jgi:molybdopterin-binding protein